MFFFFPVYTAKLAGKFGCWDVFFLDCWGEMEVRNGLKSGWIGLFLSVSEIWDAIFVLNQLHRSTVEQIAESMGLVVSS